MNLMADIYIDTIEMEKYIEFAGEIKKIYYPAINVRDRKIMLSDCDLIITSYASKEEAFNMAEKILRDEKFLDKFLKNLKRDELNKAIDKTYEDFIVIGNIYDDEGEKNE